jgi:hypothetical protein
MHRAKQKIHRASKKLGRVQNVPRLAGIILAFALQLRKKHGKTSVRVVIHKSYESLKNYNWSVIRNL